MNLSLACGLLLTLYVSTSSPVSTGKYLLVKLTGPGQAAVRSFGPGVNHREDSLRNGVEGPGSSGTLPRRQLRAGKRNRGAQGYGGGAGKPRGPPPADKDEMKSDEDVTIPGVSKEEDSESSSSLSQEETESRNGQGSSSTGSTKEESERSGFLSIP